MQDGCEDEQDSVGDAEARLLRALNDDAVQPGQLPPSQAQRGLLVLGYGVLIAVNVASGMGAFGPSNAVVSNAHPTAITPAGYAFAIWGLIFMLEGSGVVYGSLPCDGPLSVRSVSIHAVHAPWLAMWTCQVRVRGCPQSCLLFVRPSSTVYMRTRARERESAPLV